MSTLERMISCTARKAGWSAVHASLCRSALWLLSSLVLLVVARPLLPAWGVALALLVPALGSFWHARRAWRAARCERSAAARLDTHHGLGDLFSSALDFDRFAAPSPLMRCHMLEAEARAAALGEHELPCPSRAPLPVAPAIAMLLLGLTLALNGDLDGLGIVSAPDARTALAPAAEPAPEVAARHRAPARRAALLAGLLERTLDLPPVEPREELALPEEEPELQRPRRTTIAERVARAQTEHWRRVSELINDTRAEAEFRADGKFDHDVEEMVAALDAQVLRGRARSSEDLKELAAKVEDLAEQMGKLAAGREMRQSTNPVGMSRTGGFNNELQGLLRRSLSEFLENYASTLRARAQKLAREEARHGRALVAAKGLTPPKAQRTGLRSNQPPEGPTTLSDKAPSRTFKSSATPPPPGIKPQNAAGGGTSPGAQGAGAGEGPKAKGLAQKGPKADFEYLPVEARVGQGQSEMELLDEMADGSLSEEAPAAYRALIQGSTRRAAERLEQEPIPEDLREVVAEYFRSLHPDEPSPDG